MLKYIHEMKESLCKEIDEISKHGQISHSALEELMKLTKTYKNLCEIEMFEEYDGGSYDDGISHRRGRGAGAKRDSMGRYSSEGSYTGGSYGDGYMSRDDGGSMRGSYRGGSYGGYSREDGKEHMIQKLRDMMGGASNQKERQILSECMESLERA